MAGRALEDGLRFAPSNISCVLSRRSGLIADSSRAGGGGDGGGDEGRGGRSIDGVLAALVAMLLSGCPLQHVKGSYLSPGGEGLVRTIAVKFLLLMPGSWEGV